MSDINNIPILSSEIAGLWTSYMSDTMIVCMLKYFLKNVECTETRNILQQTMDLSNQSIQETVNFLNEEKLPVPDGFTDNDVNLDAPRLFTDSFYLKYLGFISRVGMQGYTLTLNQISRSDFRGYFSRRIREYIDLYNNSTDLRLSKGILIKAPRIEVSKEVQYIKGKSLISDWFGPKRALSASEITQIFGIIFANIVGRALSTGFGQVSKEKSISDYMFKGQELSSEHIRVLSAVLEDETVPVPSASDSFVTDSAAAPFSEKLMLNHQVVLCASAISSMGMALANTMRVDLETKYLGFTASIMKYTKEGTDILIDKGWIEQPPQAIRHEDLVDFS